MLGCLKKAFPSGKGLVRRREKAPPPLIKSEFSLKNNICPLFICFGHYCPTATTKKFAEFKLSVSRKEPNSPSSSFSDSN
jgi:hypothetical protein